MGKERKEEADWVPDSVPMERAQPCCSFLPQTVIVSDFKSPEQFPIERVPFCMGLVVRRKKKPTVVVPRAVGAPFSTNHELTQSSREKF